MPPLEHLSFLWTTHFTHVQGMTNHDSWVPLRLFTDRHIDVRWSTPLRFLRSCNDFDLLFRGINCAVFRHGFGPCAQIRCQRSEFAVQEVDEKGFPSVDIEGIWSGLIELNAGVEAVVDARILAVVGTSATIPCGAFVEGMRHVGHFVSSMLD